MINSQNQRKRNVIMLSKGIMGQNLNKKSMSQSTKDIEYQKLEQQIQNKIEKKVVKSQIRQIQYIEPKEIKSQIRYKIYDLFEAYDDLTQKISFNISAIDKNYAETDFVDDVNKTFHEFDLLSEYYPHKLALICDKIMNKPLTKEQQKQSCQIINQIKKQLKEKESIKEQQESQQDDDQSINVVLWELKKSLQQCGATVSFRTKSSVRTQLSIKILSTSFLSNQVICIETLDENQCGWKFDQIKECKQKIKKFKQWYIEKTSKEYQIQKTKITILNICKGSIKVTWTTERSAIINSSYKKIKRLKLHPYFKHFQLSPQDFDPRGNIEFNETKNDIERRGGWPYYQPVKCKRYGLNVSGKYDNGNDLWLQMYGEPGQWAVAFHGVISPENPDEGGKKAMNSIMEGLKKRQMLRAGWRQAYYEDPCINKEGEIIGNGIYCSPHFQVSLDNYSQSIQVKNSKNSIKQQQKEYRLIFQCRVNPKMIKICTQQTYWVINQSKNIRPYGVILVKQQRVRQIPEPEQQFGELFQYEKFKDQIEDYLQEDQQTPHTN